MNMFNSSNILTMHYTYPKFVMRSHHFSPGAHCLLQEHFNMLYWLSNDLTSPFSVLHYTLIITLTLNCQGESPFYYCGIFSGAQVFFLISNFYNICLKMLSFQKHVLLMIMDCKEIYDYIYSFLKS